MRLSLFLPASGCYMEALSHQFDCLDSLIDRVHDLFAVWRTEERRFSHLDTHVLYRLEVAVHEWLANLVQHAQFNGTVDICLTAIPEPHGIRCVIEDNSAGFDLERHLKGDPTFFATFPERGMGLLLLKMSTQELSYQRQVNGRNRLSFFVSADEDSWPSIPS